MTETDLFGNPVAPPTPLALGLFADVAIERGIDASPTGLTYAVPEGMDLSVGHRVLVPLGRGNKTATGYVVRLKTKTDLDARKLKPVESLAPGAIALPESLVDLARWVASYYVCPLGMVFGAMLPAAVTRGTGATRRQVARPNADTDASTTKLTKLQQAVLDAADRQPGWTELKHLADLAGAKSTSPVKQLIGKGLLETQHEEVVVSNLDLRAQQLADPATRLTLGKGQQDALDHLTQSLGRFGVHLLHGVTGSGKTEVYLRLIETLRDNHASPPGVIVLVPEIALTPQTVGRFLARFGPDSVAVLHSGLTAAQRHAQWRRIEQGRVSIVVGARSAVFAPLDNLQLVIVDEEHDSSYKQDQLPRYHARDVAIKRAQMAGIPVVLGSATPSLESYANAVGLSAVDASSEQK
ncbi:MAG: DEAD/DEAH box helicase, partial [Planctomycetota bacterium]